MITGCNTEQRGGGERERGERRDDHSRREIKEVLTLIGHPILVHALHIGRWSRQYSQLTKHTQHPLNDKSNPMEEGGGEGGGGVGHVVTLPQPLPHFHQLSPAPLTHPRCSGI